MKSSGTFLLCKTVYTLTLVLTSIYFLSFKYETAGNDFESVLRDILGKMLIACKCVFLP